MPRNAHGSDTIVVQGLAGDDHDARGSLLVEGASGMDARIYRDVSIREGIGR